MALPLLAGRSDEELLRDASGPTTRDHCAVFQSRGRIAGFTVGDAAVDLETSARELYRRIFSASRGLHLYRIWNYVPRINAVEGELEHYRRFCRGRSHAFEEQFGRGFQRKLPAASAVGTTHGPLAVAFLAGEDEPHHFENPRQVPAFEYPTIYGPRPPSFSRATFVPGVTTELYISGTAAIRGHATVAANDLSAQLACTRENLAIIAETAGAGADFGARDGWQRTLKVYVRQADNLPAVRADLEQHLLRASDSVTYLHADVCRSDLMIEIEAVLAK